MKHIPVLLDAVMETLGDIRGRTIVDCTFGAGGYSRAFLDAGASVIAFDRDKSVLVDVEKIKSEYGDRFCFVNSVFSDIKNLTDFDDVVELDLKYIDNWSILTDVQIILKTVGVLFRRKGAY